MKRTEQRFCIYPMSDKLNYRQLKITRYKIKKFISECEPTLIQNSKPTFYVVEPGKEIVIAFANTNNECIASTNCDYRIDTCYGGKYVYKNKFYRHF